MSTTTGATDEQIEAAHRRAWDEQREQRPYLVEFDQLDPFAHHRHKYREAAAYLVQPGEVIASAADVAKVPTVEELNAMRELVSNAPGFEETLDALTVVRAYLGRVTG